MEQFEVRPDLVEKLLRIPTKQHIFAEGSEDAKRFVDGDPETVTRIFSRATATFERVFLESTEGMMVLAQILQWCNLPMSRHDPPETVHLKQGARLVGENILRTIIRQSETTPWIMALLGVRSYE